MPTTLAKNTADILRNYFSSFTPEKRVTKALSLKSMIKCFDLPSKVGNLLLSSAKTDGNVEQSGSEIKCTQVTLNIKKTLSDATLIDVGKYIYYIILIGR